MQLGAIEKIVNREENARTEQTRLKLEIEFHATLYQIGRNDLLLRFQALLEPFFRETVKGEQINGRHKGEASHRDLLEELRSVGSRAGIWLCLALFSSTRPAGLLS